MNLSTIITVASVVDRKWDSTEAPLNICNCCIRYVEYSIKSSHTHTLNSSHSNYSTNIKKIYMKSERELHDVYLLIWLLSFFLSLWMLCWRTCGHCATHKVSHFISWSALLCSTLAFTMYLCVRCWLAALHLRSLILFVSKWSGNSGFVQ